MSGTGNCLISDRAGNSVSVEFNCGGVSVVPAREGIAVHGNHPVGKETAPFESYPDPVEKKNSRYRMDTLHALLDRQRGRLTAEAALEALADHSGYPRGICRHLIGDDPQMGTTAAVVAEPTRGKLHVARGNPCCNRAVCYEL